MDSNQIEQQNVQVVGGNGYSDKLNRFFFCFTYENLARQCRCGCNLRNGVITIIVLEILAEIILILSTGNSASIYPLAIGAFIGLIGMILIGVSLCNDSACCAYWGYIIWSIYLALKTIAYIVIILVIAFDFNNITFRGNSRGVTAVVITAVILYVIRLLLDFYYLWVVFSYTKFLSMGDFDALTAGDNGQQQHPRSVAVVVPGKVVQAQQVQNYQKVQNISNNTPPPNVEINKYQPNYD